jgi:hypothetical protein
LLKGLKDEMTIEYITTRNNNKQQKMVNYANGKIYKIECINAVEGDPDIYIGSTTKYYLSQRMDYHRRDYVQWKNGNPKVGRLTSFELFDKFGVENCRIVLIETFPCTSKDELTAQEATYIRSLKCVNKMIPHRTKAMYREEHKEKISSEKKVRVICTCGANISNHALPRHLRTKKHLDFTSTINILPFVSTASF